MGGILQVDTIKNNNATTLITQTNSTTLTFGVSGQNIVIPSGVTFNTASATVNYPAGSISNAAINASAAIAYSKLNLSNSIVNADIASSAAIATTKLGTGAVLQVVQASTTTSTIINSTSYSDTTLTASITPTSASNKILVITSQTSLIVHSANTVIEGFCQLLRTSTSLLERNGEVNTPTGANGFTVGNLNVNFVYLDSPNTTSSTTYKTQGKVSTTSNSGQIRFQSGSQASTIILMEIAG